MRAAAGRVRVEAARIRFAAHRRAEGGRAPPARGISTPDAEDITLFLGFAAESVKGIPWSHLLTGAADVVGRSIHVHDFIGVDLDGNTIWSLRKEFHPARAAPTARGRATSQPCFSDGGGKARGSWSWY